MTLFSSDSRRRGATLAGVFGLALSCVLLLCGAGTVPVENFQPQGVMQGDLNAGGHNLTNVATVSATNVVVSGSLTAPAGFALSFSQLTGTPATLGGYGITDPVVLTSGSYSNPSWLTGLAYSKLSGAPSLATVATSGSYLDLSNKPTLGSAASANTSAFDAAGAATGLLGGTNTWSGANNFTGTFELNGNLDNAAGGMVALDANGNIPFDIHGSGPNGGTLIVEGASISEGYTLANWFSGNMGYQLSQLPYFKGHLKSFSLGATISGTYPAQVITVSSTAGLGYGQLMSDNSGLVPAGTLIYGLTGTTITPSQACTNGTTTVTFWSYYNVSQGSAQVAAGTVGGQTVTGSWSSGANTIALTSSPTAPNGLMSIGSGTAGIPAGSWGTLSGSTLTLAKGVVTTAGSGGNVSITLGGNNLTDRFAAAIYPHRPTANGGDGGAFTWLLMANDQEGNEAGPSPAAGLSGATLVTNLTNYMTTARSGTGIKVASCTTSANKTTGWAVSNYAAINTVFSAELNGTIPCDLFINLGGDVLNDPSNSTASYFYTDHTHLLPAGHTAAANYINGKFFVSPGNYGNPQRIDQPILLGQTLYLDPDVTSGLNSIVGGPPGAPTGFTITAAGAIATSGSINSGSNILSNTGSFISYGGSTPKGYMFGNHASSSAVTGGLGSPSDYAYEIDNGTYGSLLPLAAANLTATPLGSTSLTCTNSGTPGSTTYTYVVVPFWGNGNFPTLGVFGTPSTVTTTTGNATLNSTNFNHIVGTNTPTANGYAVWRTVSNGTPSSVGYVYVYTVGGAWHFDDTGVAATGSPAVPTVPTSGVVTAAVINSTATQTTVSGSTSGSAVFSEPFAGASYKGAVVYLNALNGTASYTFPVPFTNTPVVLTTSGPSASVVTTLTTTGMTVTGSTTSGPVLINGY